jgi:cob(I)alamin adenosyltransferase
VLHIYCGDGKGKTTAAMGLALRAAGRGRRVLIAQFLKGADSGERLSLSGVPGVELLPVPEKVQFSFRMTEEERREAAERFLRLCQTCRERLRAGEAEVLILDEACAAVNTGLLPLEQLLELLDSAPESAEIVVTGRDPAPELTQRADYLTEMRCLRHPYQRGVSAREGVEY